MPRRIKSRDLVSIFDEGFGGWARTPQGWRRVIANCERPGPFEQQLLNEACTLCGSTAHRATTCNRRDDVDRPPLPPSTAPVRVIPPSVTHEPPARHADVAEQWLNLAIAYRSTELARVRRVLSRLRRELRLAERAIGRPFSPSASVRVDCAIFALEGREPGLKLAIAHHSAELARLRCERSGLGNPADDAKRRSRIYQRALADLLRRREAKP